MAPDEAPLPEVGVLRDDAQPSLRSEAPHRLVVCAREADIPDMGRLWVKVLERVDEVRGEVLVEQQPHAGGADASFRSRSAANAKQARMSSEVRSGKSRRISASLMPEAR